MDTETLALVVVAAVFTIAAGIIAYAIIGRWRSRNLREKFGPEYDYTIEQAGDRRAAEEALAEREKRVASLDIRPLSLDARDRYQEDWLDVQARFVDDPSGAVSDANRLITEVMIARGFPVADFEQRAADLSVIYPEFVSNYRSANEITLKGRQNETSTEELRLAMVFFHAMFDELLGEVRPADFEVEEEKEMVLK